MTTLAPGTYQIAVKTAQPFGNIDLSGTYDMTACKGYVQFRLTGPGVTYTTTLDDGDSAYSQGKAVFQAGQTYVAQDDVNPGPSKTTFTIATSGSAGSVAAASSGSTTSTTSSGKGSTVITDLTSQGTLNATVSATGKLSITFKGKSFVVLKAGNYILVVNDKSKTKGFTVQKVHKTPTTITQAAFVGTKRKVITITSGQWIYFWGNGATYAFSAS